MQQKEVWRVKHPMMWNGGLLATSGDLIFQGNGARYIAVYDAENGQELWRFDTQEGVIVVDHLCLNAGIRLSDGVAEGCNQSDECIENANYKVDLELARLKRGLRYESHSLNK